MKGKQDDEDSESDWDSISEVKPPPSVRVSTPQQVADSPQRSNASRDRDGFQQEVDNPPYSFRSEVESPPVRSSEKPPGKGTKGNQYDPAPIRRLEPMLDQMTSHNRNDDDILEKRKSRVPTKTSNQTLMTPQDQIIASLKRLRNKPTSKQLLRKDATHLEGYENGGFTDEKVEKSYSQQEGETQTKSFEEPTKKLSRTPQPTVNSLDKISEELVPKMQLELSTPLEPVGASSISTFPEEGPLKTVNSVLEKSFSVVALPFSCFFLFLHHVIRFLIVVVVKPIFLDTPLLISSLLVGPFLKRVLQPFLNLLKITLESLADIVTSILTPFVYLIKSFRLVDVNIHNAHKTHNV